MAGDVILMRTTPWWRASWWTGYWLREERRWVRKSSSPALLRQVIHKVMEEEVVVVPRTRTHIPSPDLVPFIRAMMVGSLVQRHRNVDDAVLEECLKIPYAAANLLESNPHLRPDQRERLVSWALTNARRTQADNVAALRASWTAGPEAEMGVSHFALYALSVLCFGEQPAVELRDPLFALVMERPWGDPRRTWPPAAPLVRDWNPYEAVINGLSNLPLTEAHLLSLLELGVKPGHAAGCFVGHPSATQRVWEAALEYYVASPDRFAGDEVEAERFRAFFSVLSRRAPERALDLWTSPEAPVYASILRNRSLAFLARALEDDPVGSSIFWAQVQRLIPERRASIESVVQSFGPVYL